MSLNQNNDKKAGVNSRHWDADDESGSGGTGGQGGQIEFHDFLSSGKETRDDMLSPQEQKQKLAEHSTLNEKNVRGQKNAKDQLEDKKNNKNKVTNGVQRGLGGGGTGVGSSPYADHPLSHTAQFGSGVNDNKRTSAVPSETDAKTNEEEREKPENEYQEQYKNQPHYAPQSTPKFRPPGM